MPTDVERINAHKLWLQGLGGTQLVGFAPVVIYDYNMRQAVLDGLALKNLTLDNKYVSLKGSSFQNCIIKNPNGLTIGSGNTVENGKDSVITNCEHSGYFDSCVFSNYNDKTFSGVYRNCVFINCKGDINVQTKTSEPERFYNCSFNSVVFISSVYFHNRFNLCTFYNSKIDFIVDGIYDRPELVDCNLIDTITNARLLSSKLIQNSTFEGDSISLIGAQVIGINLKGNKYFLDLSAAIVRDSKINGCSLVGSKLTNCVFINSDIRNNDLSEADLTNVKMDRPWTNCKLLNVTINGEFGDKLGDSKISGNATQTQFSKGVFMPGNYSLSNFQGVKFGPGNDLTRSKFVQTNLKNTKIPVSLEESILDQADISGADISDATFNNTSAIGLIADGVKVNQNTSFINSDFTSSYWKNTDFTQAGFNGSNLNGRFVSCKFNDLYLAAENMTNANLDTCQFDNSVLLRMNFKGLLRNNQFINSQLTGVDFSKATLVSNTFQNCDMTLVNMSGQKVDFNLQGNYLTQVNFSNGDHRNQDYSNMDLTGINFSGADIRGTKFNNCNLTNSNFSSARIDANTDFAGADLTGANLLNMGQ